jgi:hypothetical protein
MPATLSWLDFDAAEAEQTQRILALFRVREARDDLGLGSIRDSIADQLSRSTSTIQTMLPYTLFVAWMSFLAICGALERAAAEGLLGGYYLKRGVAIGSVSLSALARRRISILSWTGGRRTPTSGCG